jgi:hypothetical protein
VEQLPEDPEGWRVKLKGLANSLITIAVVRAFDIIWPTIPTWRVVIFSFVIAAGLSILAAARGENDG